jgi:hypothetical protein
MYATIHTIAPFDSSVGTNINFTWSGNQIYKVRCIIKNNATGVTAYDSTIDTMKQVYILPPTPTLINGTKYVAYITVFDVDNNESSIQNIGTPFYCFTTPTFSLSISNGDIIRASSYSIGLNYHQTENELLNWFNITLYSYQKTSLDSSGARYDTSDLSYIVTNLQNATQYYIRATGETINGMNLDTGYILFTVSYTTAQIFSKLELNNIPVTGAIEIKSNIISAEGVPEKEVTYIDGEYADLLDNSVTFDEGFEINGDFTKIFRFSKPKRNGVIKDFGTTDKLKVKIYYRQGSYSDSNGEKGYFELVASSCGINYIVNSNYVDILAGDYYYKYSLLVNRKNGYFDLKALAKGTLIRYSPNSNGSNMTESRQPNSQYVGVGYMPKEIYEQKHENLYIGTKDFSGGKWSNLSGWYSTDTPYKNLIVKKRTTPWNGLCQVIQAQADEVYTLYGYVKTDTGAKCNCQYYCGTFTPGVSAPVSIIATYKNGIKQASSQGNILDGDFYWMAHTFKVTQAGILRAGFENSVDATGMYVCGLKVVKGNYDQTVKWTPAPSEWLSDPTNYEWKPL